MLNSFSFQRKGIDALYSKKRKFKVRLNDTLERSRLFRG